MATKPTLSSAVRIIEKNGALLVFPIKNAKEPNSLWREFFPRLPMRWEWDETGDNRVGEMWVLMKRLSDCRKVVYSKWYKGRATFFSREVFRDMLCLVHAKGEPEAGLMPAARLLLDLLESDSPLSSKELKRAADLQGRDNEALYNKAMKQLFSRLLVVAFGEVDDGSFPSLAVGATRTLYEDLWQEASSRIANEARKSLDRELPPDSVFRREFDRVLKGIENSRERSRERETADLLP